MVELRGVFPYLVSPVDDDGKVREEVLRRLVDRLIDAGVHGLAPLGSTGEAAYLDLGQKQRIVEIVVDQARGRVPVVAGVFSSSTADAVRQAHAFAQRGADGIIAALTSYFPLGDAAVASYFLDLARSVDLPIVLYANPKFSGVDLDVPLLERLVQRQANILYYKDATPNTGRLMTLRCRLGDRLRLFSASSHVPLFVMLMGGVGWMAGPACLIPEQSVRLYDLVQAGQIEQALALQQQLWLVNVAFQKYSLAACVKAGLELQGFAVGQVVRPQSRLAPDAIDEIAAALRGAGAL